MVYLIIYLMFNIQFMILDILWKSKDYMFIIIVY